MKNHIAIKFIAVFLCALSLLGAVGSAGSIFALTEMDLYDKTVEQVYEEEVRREGESLAYDVSMRYASKVLGGCPEPMLAQMYHYGEYIDGQVYRLDDDWYQGNFQDFYFGYALKDAEGNVLDSRKITYDENVSTYTFQVTGQYMYLVDTITESEKANAQLEAARSGSRVMESPEAVIFDAIPPEGAVVAEIQLALRNSSYGSSGDAIGTVFRNQDGQVILRCPGWHIDVTDQEELVTAITLIDRYGQPIYDAAWHTGVGTVCYGDADSGDLIFTSFYPAGQPEAAAVPPAAAEETVPQETAVPAETTVPAETVAEETIAAESTEEAQETAAAEETVPDDTDTKKESSSEEKKASDEEKNSTEEKKDSDEQQKSSEEKKDSDSEKKSSEEKKDSDKEKKSSEEKKDSDSEKKSSEEKKASDEEKKSSEEKKASDKETKTTDENAAEPAAEDTKDAESAPAEATQAPTEPSVPETIPETVPETVPVETVVAETLPEEPQPVMINGKPLDTYQINRTDYYDSSIGENVTARYVYIPMPEMTLELQVAPGALRSQSSYTLLWIIQSMSRYLFPAMGICLLLFAVCAVYLCCAAGRKPKTAEVRAGGLNRISLDLYGLLVCFGVAGLAAAMIHGGDYFLLRNVLAGFWFIVAMGFLASLLIVGFLFALVAQIKTPDGFWWHNSLCGLCLKLCLWLFKQFLRFCVWLEEKLATKLIPLLKRLLMWIGSTLKRFCLWIRDRIHRFSVLLPVTWQWILVGLVMVFFLFVTVAGRYDFGIVLSILFALALVLYGAHCFGTLLETTKKMNKGNLNSKVDDKLMVGAFKEFAGDLNDLAGVAVEAAQKQLKSERMKTELITNVSHDIKTPLTSIINYVDLLQKPHTEEEQEQYLEVLDRQSQRLKKLIDDLMDMSKASTGNMAVDITVVDAVESVNQALGEFADKLDRAQLIPVFRHAEDSVSMMADGKLVWRVLSNLLSNAVKYAMPGTRLYIDLMRLDDTVVISLKNISQEALNIDAEELMERFVRGDDSRNTEGSGLGLNIAKSLMELQKGQLQLLVDGDLFKVTLVFPSA